MAVESTSTPLGAPAPSFDLADLSGRRWTLTDFSGQVLVVMFVCNHCPYVKHVEAQISLLATRFASRSVDFVAICSNDATAYPDDDVAHLAQQASRAGWRFPYLVDSGQDVARAFGAACTPDFFVFDAGRLLAYRGALDASTPGNGVSVDGALLIGAIEHALAGEPVPVPHRPSLGCSIKWTSAE